jgi:hypothetical protein
LRPHTNRDRKELGMSRRASDWSWMTVILLSGLGSLAAVRLAAPAVADERLTAAALVLLLPGLLVRLAGTISRPFGLLLACAAPFLWLIISRDSSDGTLLFAIPALTCVMIALAVGARPARSVIFKGATVVAAAAVLMWPMPGRPETGTRVLLIGMDGATWDIIDPLVRAGRMPNLAGLIENGHRAKLRSLHPLFSPQVWTTISTGCTPSVHGVLSFGSRSSDIRVGTLWDQMKLEGRSFGLFEWYFTWPPEPGIEERDFIVPSGLAPDCRTFPPEYSFYRDVKEVETEVQKLGASAGIVRLASDALACWRHGVRLSTMRRAFVHVAAAGLGWPRSLAASWRARTLSTALESDLAAELIRTRSPELAAVLFTDIDRVSHKYWKYMEPELFPAVNATDVELYGDVIRDTYVETDRALGKILRSAPRDADVVIVSDHGFMALQRDQALEHPRVRVLKLANGLGLGGMLLGANLEGYAYLYPIACPTEQREGILAYVEETLRDARLAGSGDALFAVNREGESIRIAVLHGPDLRSDERVVLRDEEYPLRRFLGNAADGRDSGVHHPDGIYLLSGPAARRAGAADSLNVLDVAPTVAALLDLPTCLRWPGSPDLKGLPAANTRVAEYARPARAELPPSEIDDALMKKIRALGYVE